VSAAYAATDPDLNFTTLPVGFQTSTDQAAQADPDLDFTTPPEPQTQEGDSFPAQAPSPSSSAPTPARPRRQRSAPGAPKPPSFTPRPDLVARFQYLKDQGYLGPARDMAGQLQRLYGYEAGGLNDGEWPYVKAPAWLDAGTRRDTARRVARQMMEQAQTHQERLQWARQQIFSDALQRYLFSEPEPGPPPHSLEALRTRIFGPRPQLDPATRAAMSQAADQAEWANRPGVFGALARLSANAGGGAMEATGNTLAGAGRLLGNIQAPLDPTGWVRNLGRELEKLGAGDPQSQIPAERLGLARAGQYAQGYGGEGFIPDVERTAGRLLPTFALAEAGPIGIGIQSGLESYGAGAPPAEAVKHGLVAGLGVKAGGALADRLGGGLVARALGYTVAPEAVNTAVNLRLPTWQQTRTNLVFGPLFAALMRGREAEVRTEPWDVPMRQSAPWPRPAPEVPADVGPPEGFGAEDDFSVAAEAKPSANVFYLVSREGRMGAVQVGKNGHADYRELANERSKRQALRYIGDLYPDDEFDAIFPRQPWGYQPGSIEAARIQFLKDHGLYSQKSSVGPRTPNQDYIRDDELPDLSVGSESGAGSAVLDRASPGASAESVGASTAGKAPVSEGPRNWKGEAVLIPEGHVMSPRDPSIDTRPLFEEGPYTAEQRQAFLAGRHGKTKMAPRHRHQLPVAFGGVIDELKGPGHPLGNDHTKGSPTRHPARSVLNAMIGGEMLRKAEIRAHWEAKGARLIEYKPGIWIDPGPQ